MKKNPVEKPVPMHEVPQKIIHYLHRHFSTDIVYGIVKMKDKKNRHYYLIDVNHGGFNYHLKFDAGGKLISGKTEVAGNSTGSFDETGAVD